MSPFAMPAGSPLPTGPQPRSAVRTIDFHGHAGAPAIETLTTARPEREQELAELARASGAESHRFNMADMLPRAMERMASLDARLRDLDWMGIDLQVISPAPNQYCYWAEQGLAAEVVAAANESIAGLIARAPDRLAGIGLVSLQHPNLAARQIEDVLDRHGLKGVEISASIGTRELSDPSFEPFWEAADARKLLVFIHPLGSSLGQRLDRYYLSNTIGQPVETTIALSHLIFSGVLDRYPNIRFLGAHGGGYLPSYIGRSDHAWRVRPEARGCKEPPSSYLRRIWVDTVVFEPRVVAGVIGAVGSDRVVFGTDYPYDMGAYGPHGFLDGVVSDASTKAAVLGGNAVALLGL